VFYYYFIDKIEKSLLLKRNNLSLDTFCNYNKITTRCLQFW